MSYNDRKRYVENKKKHAFVGTDIVGTTTLVQRNYQH